MKIHALIGTLAFVASAAFAGTVVNTATKVTAPVGDAKTSVNKAAVTLKQKTVTIQQSAAKDAGLTSLGKGKVYSGKELHKMLFGNQTGNLSEVIDMGCMKCTSGPNGQVECTECNCPCS